MKIQQPDVLVDQDAMITQDITGDADATADQTSDIEQ